MNPPLVSIVIASHNYGRFLGQAIESALAQDHPNLEVLVVDDGSTDDSVEVARRYPVRLISQANLGVCEARNRGAGESNGGFLLFLDSDDALEPGHVSACLRELLRAPVTVAYAYTGVRYFGAQVGILEGRPFSRELMLEGNIVHASALIRRGAFAAVRGYNLGWQDGMEDYELWIHMMDLGFEGVLVEGPLLGYRRHQSSRNTFSRGIDRAIRWRLRLTYPRLFWKKLMGDPFRTLYFLGLYWAGRLEARNSRQLRPRRPSLKS